jgi:hypothetical protein
MEMTSDDRQRPQTTTTSQKEREAVDTSLKTVSSQFNSLQVRDNTTSYIQMTMPAIPTTAHNTAACCALRLMMAPVAGHEHATQPNPKPQPLLLMMAPVAGHEHATQPNPKPQPLLLMMAPFAGHEQHATQPNPKTLTPFADDGTCCRP